MTIGLDQGIRFCTRVEPVRGAVNLLWTWCCTEGSRLTPEFGFCVSTFHPDVGLELLTAACETEYQIVVVLALP